VLLSVKEITTCARSSPLSRAQVEEVLSLLLQHHPDVSFSPKWFETSGDLDLKTPLTRLEKTNFFTKEIDEAVIQGICRIGIHSAKDLPEVLPDPLCVIAYTKGVDPSDVLVLREGESLDALPISAKIGTSSLRREKNIKALREDLICVDIRGPIDTRLALLDQGKFDGVIMAHAALIRLKLVRNTFLLPGESSPLQGRLAIVAKKEDEEMKELFACLNFCI
jgi:hydroxymethylbilane synthase